MHRTVRLLRYLVRGGLAIFVVFWPVHSSQAESREIRGSLEMTSPWLWHVESSTIAHCTLHCTPVSGACASIDGVGICCFLGHQHSTSSSGGWIIPDCRSEFKLCLVDPSNPSESAPSRGEQWPSSTPPRTLGTYTVPVLTVKCLVWLLAVPAFLRHAEQRNGLG